MRFRDGRRVLNQFGIKVARTFDLEKRPCSPRKNVAATSERASQEEHTMKKRKLGSQGLEVAELGLGCMIFGDLRSENAQKKIGSCPPKLHVQNERPQTGLKKVGKKGMRDADRFANPGKRRTACAG
jgi:hypothetical protein